MKIRSLSLFAYLFFLPAVFAQDADGAPAASARTGYMAMKVEDLPRDAQGFLTAEVWDVLAEEAKKNPNGNEARVVQERPIYQEYYKTYAGWTPPPPLKASEGRLRNLSDIPTEPRFPLTDKVWPAKPGEAAVCLWEDDKLAAMSLGVDDNCASDLPFWKEMSKKYGGLKITWNLITCNIDGVIGKGRVVSTGKWTTWQEMVKDGYRVASHSMTHNHDPVLSDGWPGAEWEGSESARLIDEHIPGYRTRTFAYPGSGVHAFGVPRSLIASGYRPVLIKHYIGARGAGRNALNQANMVDYFNINASTGSVPFLLNNDNPKLADQNLNNLFNADPKSPYYKYYRGWANVFIHFVNNGKDWEKIPFNVAYEKVLDFYNRNRDKLWTGFFDDIALYSQERDTASVVTDEATENKIAFTLTSKMEPTIFDYPLTVKVRLPDGWKGVSAKLKDDALPAEYLVHEGSPYALVKVAPDRGQVVLAPKSAE